MTSILYEHVFTWRHGRHIVILLTTEYFKIFVSCLVHRHGRSVLCLYISCDLVKTRYTLRVLQRLWNYEGLSKSLVFLTEKRAILIFSWGAGACLCRDGATVGKYEWVHVGIWGDSSNFKHKGWIWGSKPCCVPPSRCLSYFESYCVILCATGIKQVSAYSHMQCKTRFG